MERGQNLRTQVAMQATDFSGAFNSVLGKVRIAPANYTPELMAPEGPSTGGGREAMQRIRLVPSDPNYPTLVVGSANVISHRGEIRSYAYVDAAHRERFGREVALDPAGYEAFLQMVKNYFTVARLEYVVEDAPRRSLLPGGAQRAARRAAPSAAVQRALFVMAALVILSLGAVAAWFALRT